MLSPYQKLYKQLYRASLTGPTDHVGETGISSIPYFIDVIHTAKPKKILEIGFNRGSSAIKWLMNSDSSLLSIDIQKKDGCIDVVRQNFGGRFGFIQMDSKDLGGIPHWVHFFDLIFIDGDHSEGGVYHDIKNSLKLRPKFLFFDDYFHTNHGEHIRRTILRFPQLKFVKNYPIKNYGPSDDNCGQALYKAFY
jgi:hypothetical protein